MKARTSVLNAGLKAIARLYPFERGRHTLSRLLAHRLSGRGEISISGRTMSLNLDEYVDALLYLFQDYEAYEIRELSRLATSTHCSVFLDIGSHIGLYTVSLSSIVDVVHAFEPHPETFRRLLANTGQIPNVNCYPFALSDEEGHAALYAPIRRRDVDYGKLNTGARSLETIADGFPESVSIRRRRLDDVLTLRNRGIAMKIDVEGHELHTLRGMTSILSSNMCVVMIESFPDRRDKVLAFLKSHGYEHLSSHRDNHFFQNG